MKKNGFDIYGIEELFVVISDLGKFVGGVLNYDHKKNILVGALDAEKYGNIFIVGKNKDDLQKNSLEILHMQDEIKKQKHQYEYYLNEKIEMN